jgi:hypothetical protein
LDFEETGAFHRNMLDLDQLWTMVALVINQTP